MIHPPRLPESLEKSLQVPSPWQPLFHPLAAHKGIELFVKRDDLIHPHISGNKWRKLRYNLSQALLQRHDTLLTFGGAFSNHIAATAFSAKACELKSIGIIRGEEADLRNPTLSFATAQGMKIVPVSRADYARKTEPLYQENLRDAYGGFYLIPEGGANYYGVNGCMEISHEIGKHTDVLICACGTGTTAAGIALGLQQGQKLIGIPVLKGASFLEKDIWQHIFSVLGDEALTAEVYERCELVHDYHFGGYAKVNDTLLHFIQQLEKESGILTDPVYTGKLFYAVFDLIQKDFFAPGTRVSVVHTGGLQGIRGMEEKRKRQNPA